MKWANNIEEIGLRGWVFYVRFKDSPRIVVDLSNIIELAIIIGVFVLAYNVGHHDSLAYQSFWYYYYNDYCQRPDLYNSAMSQIVPMYVTVQTCGPDGCSDVLPPTNSVPAIIVANDIND